jgi:hypothetical protein
MFRQRSAIIRELLGSVWVTWNADQIGGISYNVCLCGLCAGVLWFRLLHNTPAQRLHKHTLYIVYSIVYRYSIFQYTVEPRFTNKFSEQKTSQVTYGVLSNEHASRQQRLATCWEYWRESVSCCVTFAQYTSLLEFAVPSLEFHCALWFLYILLNNIKSFRFTNISGDERPPRTNWIREPRFHCSCVRRITISYLMHAQWGWHHLNLNTLYDIPPIWYAFQVTQTDPRSSLMMANYCQNM